MKLALHGSPFISHSPLYIAKFDQFANHPTVEPPLQSHLAEACRAKMDSTSSTAESRAPARLRARSRAPKPALAAVIAFRSTETVAAEVAGPAALEWASREAIPDVPPTRLHPGVFVGRGGGVPAQMPEF